MIKLLPISSIQTISFIPRRYVSASDIEVVIIEDGTRKSQTLSNQTTTVLGNFLQVSLSINILTAESSYFFEVKKGDELLYRDKIYCTSQTSSTVSHTLNTDKYNEFVGSDSESQKYIVI